MHALPGRQPARERAHSWLPGHRPHWARPREPVHPPVPHACVGPAWGAAAVGGGVRMQAHPLDDSLSRRADAGHPNFRLDGTHGSSGSRGCPRWWGSRGPRTYPLMGDRMSGCTCGMALDGRAIVGSISYAAGHAPHHPRSKEQLNGVGRLPDLHSPRKTREVCTSDPTRGCRMLIIKAAENATDEGISIAIRSAIQFMWGNWHKEQSLPPCVPFVGGPLVSPQGITCSRTRSRTVCGLGIAPMHHQHIHSLQMRVNPRTQTRLYCMRGPAVTPQGIICSRRRKV